MEKQEKLDQQDIQDTLARQVRPVPPEHKALTDHQDQLVLMVSAEVQALQGNQDLQALRERQGHLVLPVCEVLLDSPGLLGSRESKVSTDQVVQLDLEVLQALEVLMENKDPPEIEDLVVLLARWVRPETEVDLEIRGRLGPPEGTEQPDIRECQVYEETMGRLDATEPRASQGLKDRMVYREWWDKSGSRERLPSAMWIVSKTTQIHLSKKRMSWRAS